MNISELKIGDIVKGLAFGSGEVIKIKKASVFIKFGCLGTYEYDLYYIKTYLKKVNK